MSRCRERLTIDYCISTQGMQRAEGMGQGAGAIDYFRLAIDDCISSGGN